MALVAGKKNLIILLSVGGVCLLAIIVTGIIGVSKGWFSTGSNNGGGGGSGGGGGGGGGDGSTKGGEEGNTGEGSGEGLSPRNSAPSLPPGGGGRVDDRGRTDETKEGKEGGESGGPSDTSKTRDPNIDIQFEDEGGNKNEGDFLDDDHEISSLEEETLRGEPKNVQEIQANIDLKLSYDKKDIAWQKDLYNLFVALGEKVSEDGFQSRLKEYLDTIFSMPPEYDLCYEDTQELIKKLTNPQIKKSYEAPLLYRKHIIISRLTAKIILDLQSFERKDSYITEPELKELDRSIELLGRLVTDTNLDRAKAGTKELSERWSVYKKGMQGAKLLMDEVDSIVQTSIDNHVPDDKIKKLSDSIKQLEKSFPRFINRDKMQLVKKLLNMAKLRRLFTSFLILRGGPEAHELSQDDLKIQDNFTELFKKLEKNMKKIKQTGHDAIDALFSKLSPLLKIKESGEEGINAIQLLCQIIALDIEVLDSESLLPDEKVKEFGNLLEQTEPFVPDFIPRPFYEQTVSVHKGLLIEQILGKNKVDLTKEDFVKARQLNEGITDFDIKSKYKEKIGNVEWEFAFQKVPSKLIEIICNRNYKWLKSLNTSLKKYLSKRYF